MNTLTLYLITVLVWGSTWFAITFQLGAATILASIGYRFVCASALLYLWCRVKGYALPNGIRHHLALAAMGISYALNYGLVYYAETQLNSGLVAVALSTIVISNVLLSRLFFGTPFNRGLMIGIAFGVIGIALVFAHDLRLAWQQGGDFTGLIWCLLAALGASLANMLAVRNQREGIPVMAGNVGWMFYMGSFMLLLNAVFGQSFSVQWSVAWGWSFVYLTLFGSIVAFGAYLTLFARIGAERASYISILTPIVALIWSTVFEQFHWRMLTIAGVALLLFGQILVIHSKQAKTSPAIASGWLRWQNYLPKFQW